MSYLEIIFWFSIAGTAAGAAYAVASNMMAYRRWKQMGMPDSVTPTHDAKQAAEAIGEFLLYRAHPAGRTRMSAPSGYDGIADLTCANIMSGTCFEVVDFIRMCHSLGCEVVVREVTAPGTDIEQDPRQMKEIISRMRDEVRR